MCVLLIVDFFPRSYKCHNKLAIEDKSVQINYKIPLLNLIPQIGCINKDPN